MGVRQDTMIINMGPQHPSTHGVLRMVLELEGEVVIGCRPVVGYLHTGIEKNIEYRTWQQGSTFVTRADYLAPFFNELAYCLAVERLLGIEAPPRAQTIRILVTRAEPHRQPPGLAGDHRAGAGRDLGHAVRLPRARADPGHLRDDHRPADEPRVHPDRGRRRWTCPAAPSESVRAFLAVMRERIGEYEQLLIGEPDLAAAHEGHRAPAGRATASRSG